MHDHDPGEMRAARFAQHKANVERMAETLGRLDDREVWTKMTCEEVESITEVLKFEGFHATARGIIDMHATGDEEGDLHYIVERQVILRVRWKPDGEGGTIASQVRSALRDLGSFETVEVLSIDTPE